MYMGPEVGELMQIASEEVFFDTLVLYDLGAAEGALSYPYAHPFRGVVHVDIDPAYAKVSRPLAIDVGRTVPIVSITANILETSSFGSGFYLSNPPGAECRE